MISFITGVTEPQPGDESFMKCLQLQAKPDSSIHCNVSVELLPVLVCWLVGLTPGSSCLSVCLYDLKVKAGRQMMARQTKGL